MLLLLGVLKLRSLLLIVVALESSERQILKWRRFEAAHVALAQGYAHSWWCPADISIVVQLLYNK